MQTLRQGLDPAPLGASGELPDNLRASPRDSAPKAKFEARTCARSCRGAYLLGFTHPLQERVQVRASNIVLALGGGTRSRAENLVENTKTIWSFNLKV